MERQIEIMDRFEMALSHKDLMHELESIIVFANQLGAKLQADRLNIHDNKKSRLLYESFSIIGNGLESAQSKLDEVGSYIQSLGIDRGMPRYEAENGALFWTYEPIKVEV